MYRLTAQQRTTVKLCKMKIAENQRTIDRLEKHNKELTSAMEAAIENKPVKLTVTDNVDPIAKQLRIFYKPGKANVSTFLTAAEVYAFMREQFPKDFYTVKQIGQGLTRLTGGKSSMLRTPTAIKRGYWLQAVKPK